LPLPVLGPWPSRRSWFCQAPRGGGLSCGVAGRDEGGVDAVVKEEALPWP